jgi:hypothetical protein
MTNKKNEVAVKPNTSAAVPMDALSALDEISSGDLKMARIKVMASNAELVNEGRARAGAIIDLESHEELGFKDEEPVEFVILRQYKYWYKTRNGQFAERCPALHRNEREWKLTEKNGDEIINDFYHEFIVLLVNQVKEGIEVPYTMRFRRGELKQLEKVTKEFVKMGKAGGKDELGRNIARSWWTSFILKAGLGTKNLPNGKKSQWITPLVEVGEPTSKEVRKVAADWAAQTLGVDVNPTVSANTESDDDKYGI